MQGEMLIRSRFGTLAAGHNIQSHNAAGEQDRASHRPGVALRSIGKRFAAIGMHVMDLWLTPPWNPRHGRSV